MPIKECTEDLYDEMLCILPPALWLGYGFLVGEPYDHRRCTITNHVMPTYAAFFNAFGKFYEGDPLTVAEFRAQRRGHRRLRCGR
jgi:hypothetical protein